MNDYWQRLKNALGSVDDFAIEALTGKVADARSSGVRLWLIGNGGSATTADHFATDLLRCTDINGAPVRATSLCSNQGVITATANDFEYQHVFTRQLQTFASAGDVLVSISASGNSPNIVDAVKWSKAHSIFTVALTGFDGGTLRTLADLSVHVASAVGDYGVVEDIHLSICHVVAENLRI